MEHHRGSVVIAILQAETTKAQKFFFRVCQVWRIISMKLSGAEWSARLAKPVRYKLCTGWISKLIRTSNNRQDRLTPPNSMERRRSERELLAYLDRRTWHLWVPVLSISVFLALGIAVFLYPALAWKVEQLGVRLTILPQLVTGLLVLIVLQSVYVVLKQKQVNEMRDFIISRYAETWIREDLARDPLTGVLDRRTLPDIIERERAWADRYNLPLCLIFLDIRGFREINESGGHLAGDIILKDLACTLQSTVRQTDTVIRYDPDEFLCFLPRTDRAGGEGFTRRLSKRCQEVARLRDLPLDFEIAVYEAGMNLDGVLTEVERQLKSNKSPVTSPAHLQRSAAEPL